MVTSALGDRHSHAQCTVPCGAQATNELQVQLDVPRFASGAPAHDGFPFRSQFSLKVPRICQVGKELSL